MRTSINATISAVNFQPKKAPVSLVFKFLAMLFPLFFVIACGGGASGDTETEEATGKDPLQAGFHAANSKIRSHKVEEGFGNTPTAETMAKSFAVKIAAARKENFTRGKKSKFSMTDGHFLTYFQQTDDHVVVLCHVPGLKKFKGDVRTILAEYVWEIAQSEVKEKLPNFKGNVTIAMRGAVLYDGFYTGKVDDTFANLAKKSSSEGKTMVYPIFAKSAAPVAPAATSAPTTPAAAPATTGAPTTPTPAAPKK